jgi:hypothetical protein
MIRARKSVQQGFLLIGVIMFVLALSILGLSLYSLSSYEAQFLRQSRDSNVALYRSQGGLEMVKALLASPPYTLHSAKQAMGHEGVALVTAYQMRSNGTVDTVGSIDFNDTVSVNVLVRQGTTSRCLHADYLPKRRKDYYKRLFTVANTPTSNGPLNNKTIQLSGRTWIRVTAASDSSWLAPLRPGSNPHFENLTDKVDAPDVAGYFAQFSPLLAVTPDYDSLGSNHRLSLNVSNGTTWYRSPQNRWSAGPANEMKYNFDLFDDGNLRIDVRGTAILELPHGARFEDPVQVRGSGSSPTLVIVAQRSGREPGFPEAAIWFAAGLDIDDKTTVILVSDDKVLIDAINPGQNEADVLQLSVYSNELFLKGPPTDPDNRWKLGYAASMDAIIDGLEASGYLPQPTGAIANAFTFVKGSWHELKP